MKYDDYLKTEYWAQVQKAVKKRAGWKCQICNSPHDLNAHHRTYDHRGNELDHLDDLTCLCRRCHHVFHGFGKPPEPAKPNPPKPQAEPKQKRQRVIDWAWVDANMPQGDAFVLNKELVERCMTDKRGFTTATQRALGVPFPLVTGWQRRLYGSSVSRMQYKNALAGRFIFA